MGKKNYSKFSENLKNSEEVIEETKNEMVEEIMEVIEETPEIKLVTGVVVNCDKLNVREKPSKDAKVLQVLNKNDEIKINLYHEGEPVPSDLSFYKVITSAGVEGYCVINYIKLK